MIPHFSPRPQAILLPAMLAILLAADSPAPQPWKDSFNIPAERFTSTGRNRYFILEPGYRLVLEGKDGGKKARLVITVLDETRIVDGVETRIVEERESADGALVEISRNYFAINRETGDAYYFGEAVDIYKRGRVVAHEGAWESGKDGAHYGLFMPARPEVGQKYYQELAPKVAMDRAEVVSVSEQVQVPAGTFDGCLKTEESSAIEKGKELKRYAPDIGLLTDEDLKLIEYGKPQRP